MNNSLASPVQQNKRIEFIDILRGFALLGVILVNIYAFNKPPFGHIDVAYKLEGIQHIFSRLFGLLFTSKFLTIFSFLFGLGFSLQMERLKIKTDKYWFLYLKRTFFLLLIGVIHVCLLFEGDILVEYAIVGFILLLFHKSKTKTIFRWIIFLFCLLFLHNTYRFIEQYKKPIKENSEVVENKPDSTVVNDSVSLAVVSLENNGQAKDSTSLKTDTIAAKDTVPAVQKEESKMGRWRRIFLKEAI